MTLSSRLTGALMALLIASALSGCTSLLLLQTLEERRQVYDPADYAWYFAGGEGALTGTIVDYDPGGGARTCAGRAVFLAPDGPHTRGQSQLAGQAGESTFSLRDTWSSDDTEDRLVRETGCDAQGRFGFSGLAPGPYLVQAEIGDPPPGFLHLTVKVPAKGTASVLIARRCALESLSVNGSPARTIKQVCRVREESRGRRGGTFGGGQAL